MGLGRSGGARLAKFIPPPLALWLMWPCSGEEGRKSAGVKVFPLGAAGSSVVSLSAPHYTLVFCGNGSPASFRSSIRGNRKQLVILAFIVGRRLKIERCKSFYGRTKLRIILAVT